jgi:hypothetical protein
LTYFFRQMLDVAPTMWYYDMMSALARHPSPYAHTICVCVDGEYRKRCDEFHAWLKQRPTETQPSLATLPIVTTVEHNRSKLDAQLLGELCS